MINTFTELNYFKKELGIIISIALSKIIKHFTWPSKDIHVHFEDYQFDRHGEFDFDQ